MNIVIIINNIMIGLPGKAAVSHVRTLCFDGKLSVCLVRIETGRLDLFYVLYKKISFLELN